MSDPNLEMLKYDTYISIIKNSIGSKLFNSFIVRSKVTGDIEDILKDGEYSDAFFVSSVLTLTDAIDRPCTTAVRLEQKLTADEKWFIVTAEEIEAGDVIFYEKTTLADGSTDTHVGFALDDSTVISSNAAAKQITKHDLNSLPIKKVYRHIW